LALVKKCQRSNVYLTPKFFVFFTGDAWPGKNCPDTPQRWRQEIEQRDAKAQLPSKHPFNNLIHKLFLDVQGKSGVYSI